MATRTLASNGVGLSVSEAGDASRPTVVLVHGYPDTSAVWDEVVQRLAPRYHVVTYDVRGAGASTTPTGRKGFALENLIGDLAVVLDAVSPGRAVHLVGHDWGSVQGWEAACGQRLVGRLASFTSISGPCLDHIRPWVTRRLASGPRGWAQLMGQGFRSWYVGFFQAPVLPGLAWRTGVAELQFRYFLKAEGVQDRPGHPAATLAHDGRVGVGLYRQNMARSVLHRSDGRARVPVQLVVPTKDRYLSPALYQDIGDHVDTLWEHRLDAGHWVQRTHPDQIAQWIAEVVDRIEGPTEPTPDDGGGSR